MKCRPARDRRRRRSTSAFVGAAIGSRAANGVPGRNPHLRERIVRSRSAARRSHRRRTRSRSRSRPSAYRSSNVRAPIAADSACFAPRPRRWGCRGRRARGASGREVATAIGVVARPAAEGTDASRTRPAPAAAGRHDRRVDSELGIADHCGDLDAVRERKARPSTSIDETRRAVSPRAVDTIDGPAGRDRRGSRGSAVRCRRRQGAGR